MRRRQCLALALPATLRAQTYLPISTIASAASDDPQLYRPALEQLKNAWRPAYAPMLLEAASLLHRDPAARERLLRFLQQRTRQLHLKDMGDWRRYLWSLPYKPHPEYDRFKGMLYALIDPRMQEFFPADRVTPSRIRLDQVQWGGVRVNGIPPLVNPTMLPAAQASYLKDSHIVFGVHLNGDARAYPKRILAWHEMANDRIGGQDICLVYCTLCGTVIPYYSAPHNFGTSGLLYESSKLMFDEETKSLWSTLQGQPVIGPLATSGLQLSFANVVTTTWGEWRARHPRTTVLSLQTGHQRDYSEGAAYRDYFATQELMFEVSRPDPRLRNKDEILAIRLPDAAPLAIAVRHLRKHPKLELQHAAHQLLIETSSAGAHSLLVDGQPYPAHRAFWFGWITQFPNTVLIR